VNERIRPALLAAAAPDELEAQRRAWAVVRAAYAEREPAGRARRPVRPVLALAALVVAVAAAASPPGQALGDWLRERIVGREDAEPALVRVPAPGRLLVLSERGPWIVQRDGSKRLLGRYEDASFSPRGLYVVVTRGRRVVAVEPDGDPRWSLTRPEQVGQARWAPSGFRVAYRAGDTLRVVVGNGQDDRLLARSVAPVAPAWRPGARHVLAYAGLDRSVHVVDADTERELWRSRPETRVASLAWSADGRRLLAVGARGVLTVYRADGRRARRIELPAGATDVEAAFAPGGGALAYTAFHAARDASTVGVVEGRATRTLFTGAGRLEDVAWSPDGGWLLVGWPEADQWLFLRLPDVARLRAVEGIRREFDPGGEAPGSFPRVAGWCCAG
jgi:hypothetical protein